MGLQAQLWTLSALEVELSKDRRTLAKLLDALPADEQETDKGGRVHRKWKMARVVDHLLSKSSPQKLDIDDERARLASEQADRAAMDNAVRRGELIELSVLAPELARAFTAFRQKSLAMPSKLAPNVNPDNPNVARDIIEGDVHRVLGELADHFAEAARGELVAAARDAGGDAETSTEAEDLGMGGHPPPAEQRNKRRARAVPD